MLVSPGAHRERQLSPRRNLLLSLTGIVGLAAGLRLPLLGHSSLWWDECHTLQVASAMHAASPLRVLSAVFRGYSSYFLLLVPWVGSATSEWALRLPSVLAGMLLPGILLLLGREWGGDSLGWRAGVAAAISPFLVWHSREARWYPFTWLLIAISAIAFLKVLRQPNWRWALLCILVGLVAATSYAPAILLVGTQALWFACSAGPREEVRRAWSRSPLGVRALVGLPVACCLIAGGVWIWSTLLAPVLSDGARGFRFVNVGGPNLGAAAYTGVAFATGYTLGPGPSEWHRLSQIQLSFVEIAAMVLGALAFLGLVASGLVELTKAQGPQFAGALLTLSTLPAAIILAASWWSDHAFAPRHVGVSYPFLVLLAAAGFPSPGRRRAAGALAAILVALQALSLWNLYSNPRYQREDVRDAAQYVTEHASMADLILVFGGIDLPWKHYYRGETRWKMVYEPGGEAWPIERQGLGQAVWTVEGMMWEGAGTQPVLARVESDTVATERREFPGRVIVTRREFRPQE